MRLSALFFIFVTSSCLMNAEAETSTREKVLVGTAVVMPLAVFGGIGLIFAINNDYTGKGQQGQSPAEDIRSDPAQLDTDGQPNAYSIIRQQEKPESSIKPINKPENRTTADASYSEGEAIAKYQQLKQEFSFKVDTLTNEKTATLSDSAKRELKKAMQKKANDVLLRQIQAEDGFTTSNYNRIMAKSLEKVRDALNRSEGRITKLADVYRRKQVAYAEYNRINDDSRISDADKFKAWKKFLKLVDEESDVMSRYFPGRE